MVLKSLLYNSVTVSLPKNIVQFLLGVVLFWIITTGFDIPLTLLAMAAFVITYSSVYFYNDVIDAEDDRRDSDKKAWKLVASGVLGKRAASFLGTAFLLVGLSLSVLVNVWFMLLMSALVVLNFLHSSPYTGFKKRVHLAAANMTAIEFLKYSSGWFALTSNLSLFPLWLVMCFALIYSGVYLVYKFRFKGKIIKENKHIIVIIGIASAFSYVSSIILYGFALPMILLLVIAVLMAWHSKSRKLKFMNWLWVEFILLPIFLLAFLMLSVPQIAQANANITETIDQYMEDFYSQLPEDMSQGLRDLTEPQYESLDDMIGP
jgi:4-hydroxybenzoate polyprenyltransferase